MMMLSIQALVLILPFAFAWADSDQACREQQFAAFEQKTIANLDRAIARIEAQAKTQQLQSDNLGNEQCRHIVNQIDRSFRDLFGKYIDHYRLYLNDFYQQSVQGAVDQGRQVEGMKRLAGYMRKGEVQELIRQYRTTPAVFDGPDPEENLRLELYARYKTLRKNLDKYIGGPTPTMLPVTEIQCGRESARTGAELEEQVQSLVVDHPVLDLDNRCSYFYNDGYEHPKLQKTIGLEINERRVRLWFCQQRFTSRIAPEGKRGNHGDFVVTSKGDCLAYDLEHDRFDLGDQWELNSDDPISKFYQIEDTRAAMVRAQGLAPLSLQDFGIRYPKLVPEEEIFQKIPRSCRRWSFTRDALERTKQTLNYQYRRYTLP